MTLKHLLAALAALALAASAGCGLGEVDAPPPGDGDGDGDGDSDLPDTEGAEAFANDVQPMLARCAGVGCHTGETTAPLKFLGTGPESEYYTSITKHTSVTGNFDPAVANLLLMVQNGDHYEMPDWNEMEKGAIVSWLMVERSARGLEPEEPVDPDPEIVPTNSRQAFAQWAGCMTKDNWDETNMGSWASKGSDEGPCQGCHNQGAYRFYANDSNTNMFNMNKTELYIISFFKASVGDDGTVSVVPAWSKLERMGMGDPALTNHPEFSTSPGNSRIERLQAFYELTQQTLEDGNCGPAEFFVP